MTATAGVARVVDLSGDGGVTRKVLREGVGQPLVRGDVVIVKYTGVVEQTGAVFTQGERYRSTVEDSTMISGWDIGLAGLRIGDQAVVKCKSRYAYGAQGIPPIIPPGADLRFDIEVLEYEGNIMNPASFRDFRPMTPRDPGTIMQAFQRRQRLAAEAGEVGDDERSMLENIVKRLKTSYVFGLFEGQTGQRAPWYLRPAITFPLMFGFTAVAFAAVLFLNGITTNRVIQVQDDADVAMQLLDQHQHLFKV